MFVKGRISGRAGAALALVLLLVPVLTACGGTSGTATTVPATSPTAAAAESPSAATCETPSTGSAESPTAMAAESPSAATGGTPSEMAATPGTSGTSVTNETPSLMGSPTTGTGETPGATGTAGTSGGQKLKVGLVTDVGKVNDGTFNQYAYEGLKRAESELGIQTAYIETQAQTDYEKNLEQFASQNYDMIIAVGFFMGDALKSQAAKHPNIKYAIVDFSYSPDIPNVRGLVFAEDQAGYMAGVLAGSMSKSGTVAVVGGIEGVPAVKRYVLGYTNGAKSVKPDINVRSVYIDSFTDRARGAEAAKNFISEGADVIFGAGGQTGSGGIQAAAQQGVYAIGVDQDEYVTTFQNGKASGANKLLSSAVKRVDVAVYQAIKDATQGKFSGGTQLFTAANQGVGLAPFHDTDSVIPADVKTKLNQTLQGLANGSIQTGVNIK